MPKKAYKPLTIVKDTSYRTEVPRTDPAYAVVLSNLAVAEAFMVRYKDSALPHFIAIVKELEKVLGFKFEEVE